jgi:hypothetical protein
MPVRMLPAVPNPWPAHLTPPGETTEEERARVRESRTFEAKAKPLPRQERRRIYLEGKILTGGRREEWRKSLRVRRKPLDPARGQA